MKKPRAPRPAQADGERRRPARRQRGAARRSSASCAPAPSMSPRRSRADAPRNRQEQEPEDGEEAEPLHSGRREHGGKAAGSTFVQQERMQPLPGEDCIEGSTNRSDQHAELRAGAGGLGSSVFRSRSRRRFPDRLRQALLVRRPHMSRIALDIDSNIAVARPPRACLANVSAGWCPLRASAAASPWRALRKPPENFRGACRLAAMHCSTPRARSDASASGQAPRHLRPRRKQFN